MPLSGNPDRRTLYLVLRGLKVSACGRRLTTCLACVDSLLDLELRESEAGSREPCLLVLPSGGAVNDDPDVLPFSRHRAALLIPGT